MTIWFTSDTHYGHSNIIKYSERPFSSVEEMDQAMIDNWNMFVDHDDEVYHLGDFAYADVGRMKEIIYQLKGKKYFLPGNHDREFFSHELRTLGGCAIQNLHELRIKDKDAYDKKMQMIVLCHYSLRVWNKSHFGSWNAYGHSHGSLFDDPTLLSMDVGVDSVAHWLARSNDPKDWNPRDYRPISYHEMKSHMKTKTWKPVDHHDRVRK